MMEGYVRNLVWECNTTYKQKVIQMSIFDQNVFYG